MFGFSVIIKHQMNAENIVKSVYENVLKYFKTLLGTRYATIIVPHLHKKFPSWEHAWQTIRGWLKEHSLTNMQTSMHSFAQLFPKYEEFAKELDDCLVLHDEFWNQVHLQLCLAKRII